MQSRRKFLSDCSLLAAGSCLAPVAGLAENASGPARVAGTPSFGEFLRQVNTAFTGQMRQAGLEGRHHVYFLCRSGVRSLAAAHAATAAGAERLPLGAE